MTVYTQTLNMYFVVHGCETWSLTLLKEPRLRVFQNRVLREIFGEEGRGKRGVEKTT